MLSVLQLHKKSSNGICRTLVMKWMCERAHGRDFWDWLMPGGRLNVGAVANVAIQHINVGKVDVDPTTMRGMLEQRPGSWREDLSGSTAMMDQYMRYYGNLTTSTQLFVKGKAKHYTADIEGGVPDEMGRLVRDEPPPNPAFLFGGMTGGGGGHALGAETIAGGSVQFYDPNLGEAEFDTADGFADWMKALGQLVYKKYNMLNYEWYN